MWKGPRDYKHKKQYRFEPYKRNKNKKYDIVEKVQAQKETTSQLILFHSESDPPYVILHNAVDRIKAKLNVANIGGNTSNEHSFQLTIDGEVFAEGQYGSITEARRNLAELALAKLRKTCFTIFRKIHPSQSPKIDLNPPNTSVKSDDQRKVKSTADFQNIGGIGAKMMKQMGWTGGGLGANEQGQTEIIRPYFQIERQGLGSENIVKEIRDVLEKYASSGDINSIAFSSDFSKEERAHIHKVAQQLSLKSKSYGQNEERTLVVQSKIRPLDLIYKLIDSGGETNQFKLIYPTDIET